MAKLAKAAKLNHEVLIRPVRTRWNTVTTCVGRAIDSRSVLTGLCDMVQFNQNDGRGVQLRRYILTPDEWTILGQLFRMLYVRR